MASEIWEEGKSGTNPTFRVYNKKNVKGALAVRLIVDGYNVLGQQKGLRGDLRAKRERLIERLVSYRSLKGFPVTIVFDGDANDREGNIDRRGELEVVFSRGETADEVICRMAERLREGCTVVSSDREIQTRVRKSGATAIYSGEFEERLQRALAPSELHEKGDFPEESPRPAQKKGNPSRLPKSERRRQGRLRRL